MKTHNPSTDEAARIYRNAAKAIEDRSCPVKGCTSCCCALSMADATREQESAFESLFRPELPDDPGRPAHWWNTTDEAMDARVLALCFMAAMVEAGDA